MMHKKIIFVIMCIMLSIFLHHANKQNNITYEQQRQYKKCQNYQEKMYNDFQHLAKLCGNALIKDRKDICDRNIVIMNDLKEFIDKNSVVMSKLRKSMD